VLKHLVLLHALKLHRRAVFKSGLIVRDIGIFQKPT